MSVMTDTPERCHARAEAPRTDEDGAVLLTDAGETFTEPVECELPSGHESDHRGTTADGGIFNWSRDL
jgi:hypothetical protein